MLRGRRKVPAVERVSFVFLESGVVKSWRVDPVKEMCFLQELLSGAFTIAGDQTYAPRPSPWCRGCDFLEICPAGQAAGRTGRSPVVLSVAGGQAGPPAS